MATSFAYSHPHSLDADDVLAGLRGPRKRLPSRLLRTELFERICRLDAYYPARLEQALLADHVANIAHQVGRHARVIEPGSGEGVKTRTLLHALDRPSAYVPVDTAHEQLQRTAAALRTELPGVEISPVTHDYTQPFDLPVPQHAVATTLVFMPGSTIGGFEPGEARALLAQLGQIAGPDRLLLLGADATRDVSAIERAYEDEMFTKHVLARLNATRGATFDLHGFEHRATWNPTRARIELSLVSTARQVVQIDDEVIAFASGESIEIAHSYKHTPAAMQAILVGAGWRLRQVFTARERPVRLWLCEPLR